MRVLCMCAVLLWSGLSLAVSESQFEGANVTVDACGSNDTFQPILLLLDGLEATWKEDTAAEEKFSTIVAFVAVQEGEFPYPLAMQVRGKDVYSQQQKSYDDDGNEIKQYDKIGEVISDDTSGLVLEADFEGRISLQVSITGTTATINGKMSHDGCEVTWKSTLQRTTHKEIEVPQGE